MFMTTAARSSAFSIRALFHDKRERQRKRFTMEKKVDATLLEKAETPIPIWVASLWDLSTPVEIKKNDPSYKVRIEFERRQFIGSFFTRGGKSKLQLHLSLDLGERIS